MNSPIQPKSLPPAQKLTVIDGHGKGTHAEWSAALSAQETGPFQWVEVLDDDGYIDWEASDLRHAKINSAGKPLPFRLRLWLKAKFFNAYTKKGWFEKRVTLLYSTGYDFVSARFASAGDKRWYTISHGASAMELARLRAHPEWKVFESAGFALTDPPSKILREWVQRRCAVMRAEGVLHLLGDNAELGSRAAYDIEKAKRKAQGLPAPSQMKKKPDYYNDPLAVAAVNDAIADAENDPANREIISLVGREKFREQYDAPFLIKEYADYSIPKLIACYQDKLEREAGITPTRSHAHMRVVK